MKQSLMWSLLYLLPCGYALWIGSKKAGHLLSCYLLPRSIDKPSEPAIRARKLEDKAGRRGLAGVLLRVQRRGLA
ncbi:hypothetical protein GGR57DRAFT_488659 [Xylariaceae sp. FL1272]|nr:hypothetical protein GGR57DRAFT_488659 [Xylariaceae sp. FL1272]